MSSKPRGNCSPCHFKDQYVTAYFFCQTCDDYLCKPCREKHLSQLISKGHLVQVWNKEMSRYDIPATNVDHGSYYEKCGQNNIHDQSDIFDFEADILDNEASRHCHLSGKCIVRLDSCSIAITEVAKHVTFCWPFTTIRRYGSMVEKIFFFESGRRCDAGEGRFVLLTHDAVSLHKHLTNFIRLIENKKNPSLT